ncbi:MAG: outer membrane protein [Marinobacter excellens HL-55]|uniref:Outer membrane protein n=1 Tax=Marinobacter excellens HL-55 TaxID=1305731 RepID=A0A0P8BPU4_9GAMM|nr:MAG: outer membrane protein [Marinobacter excellens HL-55]
MRKLIIAVGGTLILAAPLAQADIVGFGASANYWDSDLSGKAGSNGDTVDIENDLNLDSDSNTNLTAYVEHPVPLLPNVRLDYTKVDLSGRGQLGVLGYDGVNGDVRSELDLEQLDLTLYYEVLDNWVNLDLGLTARRLDAELLVQETTGTLDVSETSVDAVIPMGYAAARFDLPFTGVSVGAEGNFISFDGDLLHDINAYGQFEFALLRVRAGYRQMSIDYEDGDDSLDIEIDGPFASVGVTF